MVPDGAKGVDGYMLFINIYLEQLKEGGFVEGIGALEGKVFQKFSYCG